MTDPITETASVAEQVKNLIDLHNFSHKVWRLVPVTVSSAKTQHDTKIVHMHVLGNRPAIWLCSGYHYLLSGCKVTLLSVQVHTGRPSILLVRLKQTDLILLVFSLMGIERTGAATEAMFVSACHTIINLVCFYCINYWNSALVLHRPGAFKILLNGEY